MIEDDIMNKEESKTLTVIMARPISSDFQSVLEKNIKREFSSDIYIKYYTDPSMIGGIKLCTEKNRIIDYSIKGKIEALKDHLREEIKNGKNNEDSKDAIKDAIDDFNY